MSETEKQFREYGWERIRDREIDRWRHPRYGTIITCPLNEDDVMDAWITGFVAGKESE